RRLSGVEDACFGARDLVDPPAGDGRDTGEMTHQVERGAFRGQQCTNEGTRGQQDVAGCNDVAVVKALIDNDRVIRGDFENSAHDGQARDDARSTGDEVGDSFEVKGDGGKTRDIDTVG